MFSGNTIQINLYYFFQLFPFGKIDLYDYISKETLTIKFIWILTAVFTSLFIIFFFLLIISRLYKNIQKRRREKIKNELAAPLSIYLFDDSIQEALSKKNHAAIFELFEGKCLKNSFHRYILSKELIRLHSSYSGDIAYKLEQLFAILKFDKEVGKNIKSQRWNVRANAINDAAQMNLVQYSKRILNSVNHPNTVVRSEARVAAVRLNKKSPFFFF